MEALMRDKKFRKIGIRLVLSFFLIFFLFFTKHLFIHEQLKKEQNISHTMNVIQDITSQTSSGTMATARSIGELSEMAAALQESVTGFKISNDDELLDADMLESEEALSESV